MTKEEAKQFGLQLLHGIMERNESYPVYANNVKQAIDALSESGSSEIPNDLEEAAHLFSESPEPLYSPGYRFHWDNDALFGKQIEASFIAGAKWQAEHAPLPEDTALFNKGMDEGKRLMMKEAVEAKIYGYDDGSYELIASWLDLPKGIYKDGEKVRIIILKEN